MSLRFLSLLAALVALGLAAAPAQARDLKVGIADASADELVDRDAKEYEVGHAKIAIAQVETVGKALADRTEELREALVRANERHGRTLSALMVTDILDEGTTLIAVGDLAVVERAFGDVDGGVVDLPGVMSRKKQVAPVLLGAV